MEKRRRGERGVWTHGIGARSPFCASSSTRACFVMRRNGPSGHAACLHNAHTWAFVCRWKTASGLSLSGRRVHCEQYMFMKAKRYVHSEHSFDVKWTVNHFKTKYCVTPQLNVSPWSNFVNRKWQKLIYKLYLVNKGYSNIFKPTNCSWTPWTPHIHSHLKLLNFANDIIKAVYPHCQSNLQSFCI